jgi:hypothetical protein
VRIHRTRHLDPRDCAEVRGIPVTSVVLTLVDLAEVLDDQSLAKAIHEAEVQRLFDANQFARFRGRRGAHRLLALLEDPSATVTKEEFDHRFLALCRSRGLPLPQMHIHLDAGARLVETDAVWADVKVCVELDGAQVRRTRRAFEEDRRRDIALASEGYVVVRVTWKRLTTDGGSLTSDLRRLFARRTASSSEKLGRALA